VLVTDDRSALEALLGKMRAIHAELDEFPAGIALLHLDAAVAALESRLHGPMPMSFAPRREQPLHAAR
jgi:hypothetical protein